ncbi:unnamed protein product [Adineta steineri]|uniref:SAM dependent carboxyl methyltransferase n=1 Tax=Adineta steineri TaxID=433720 RepID=A0A815BKK9_9BILA|nr:unnamed protein product [Adineta steineri]CAF3855066.1 unnamed protein product [Adineta steineri]
MVTTQLDATMGMGESYNKNSKVQLSTIDLSIPSVRKAIDALDVDCSSSAPFIIADFGCAQGLNSLHVMKIIINYLQQTNKNIRELLVVHNDLPTNDWTSILKLLAEDHSYKSVISGRSFYEQCLPNNSLSIGYTSTSIHWLSKMPCNLSNHCLCFFAVGDELAAFQDQSRLDYIQFLEHRSHELRPGGVLILANVCLDNQGKSGLENVMDLLYKCAQQASFTEQELLDYTIPFYARSYKDFVDEELFTRYSLEVVQSECVPAFWFTQWRERQMTLDEFARLIVSYFRAWSEPTIQQTLIRSGRTKEDIAEILNRLWNLCEQEIKQQPDHLPSLVHHAFIILKKKLAVVQE